MLHLSNHKLEALNHPRRHFNPINNLSPYVLLSLKEQIKKILNMFPSPYTITPKILDDRTQSEAKNPLSIFNHAPRVRVTSDSVGRRYLSRDSARSP